MSTRVQSGSLPAEAGEVSFLSLPPSAFLFHLCTYLSAFDLLSLRLTSKQIHEIIHREGDDSEQMWQRLLQRDFGLDSAIGKDPAWNQVLNLKFPNPRVTPLFGVDPADSEFILSIETGAFDVWKYWLKADLRVLPQRNSALRVSNSSFIYAPYFLRAAKFWQSLLRWCDMQETGVGGEIRASLGTAFEGYGDLIRRLTSNDDGIPKTSCRMAVLAIYAFSSGQGNSFRRQTPFDGLLGGYHAYGYYSSMRLIAPKTSFLPSDQTDTTQRSAEFYHLRVAEDLVGEEQRIAKFAAMDLQSGKLMFMGKTRICFSSPGDNPHGDESSISPPNQDDFLRWLEEYVRRLTTGVYRVELLGSDPSDPRAITLFPQFPTTPEASVPTSPSSSIPIVGRSVTRGVEVVASAVYAPQGGNRFGFIYCIRLRLLQPGEEGYQTEEERGFATCQLQSRHWRIANDSTGRTDHVDGQGVIGMYPLLRDGGFSHEGNHTRFIEGTFHYQSCTGPMGTTGSFGGHLDFVPGTLLQPTGPLFAVEMAPFLLDSRQNYWY